MVKTIRMLAFEEFLAAISTRNEVSKHSKAFIYVLFQTGTHEKE